MFFKILRCIPFFAAVLFCQDAFAQGISITPINPQGFQQPAVSIQPPAQPGNAYQGYTQPQIPSQVYYPPPEMDPDQMQQDEEDGEAPLRGQYENQQYPVNPYPQGIQYPAQTVPNGIQPGQYGPQQYPQGGQYGTSQGTALPQQGTYQGMQQIPGTSQTSPQGGQYGIQQYPGLQQPGSQPGQFPPASQKGRTSLQGPGKFPASQMPKGLIQPPYGTAREELSDFEKYVAGKSPRKLSFDIKQFGYDLFLSTPSPVSPSRQKGVPVGPEYVLGPGDELRVNVWGSIEGVWNPIVDRNGSVTLPKIGSLGVTGLTFKEAKELLYKEYSKSFSDFEMNVSMGQLKSQKIYVVGKAKKPGAFTVSSLSTLINALQEAGGPSKVGTMRDIQLKRDGQVITHLDLYDFLLTGEKRGDVRLMPDDVIFIPAIGPMVGIAGDVKSPAIYELKGSAKVSDLIKLAGGVTAKADVQRVQVERIGDKSNKVILDLNLNQLKGKDDISIKNGDIVKVFSVPSNVSNKIVLRGNVWKPGEYEWRAGMRVRDLIRSTEDLKPETLMERIQIDRLVPPDYHLEYRTINLGKLLLESDGQENVLLEPYDTVWVYNQWMVKEKDKVRTAGALNKPGEFDFRPNMKLSDLIGLSGGMLSYAMTETAELTRVTPTPEGPKTEKITVYPAGALQGNPADDMLLKENDYLFVRTIPEWNLYQMVKVEGEVKFPGTYTVAKGEKLSSVLGRAGGFTSSAYLPGAVFKRESVRKVQQEQVNQMVERLQRELMTSGSANIGAATTADEAKVLVEQEKQKATFLDQLRAVQAQGRMVINIEESEKLKRSQFDVGLEDGDSLYVPVNPQSVQIIGAVYNQTGILYERGRDYKYYIQMAGGFSENADKKNVYILKANGRAIKPKGAPIWDRAAHQWAVGYGQVEPGDTIVVPDKLDKVPWMKHIKDIAQILFQIGTTAGIAFVAM